MTSKNKHNNDPGIGTKFYHPDQRLINKDGSFNVRRDGISMDLANIYQLFINMSWPRFLLLVLLAYIVSNLLFSLVYFSLGTDFISSNDGTSLDHFTDAFYFSCQTFTTVGYGHLFPIGKIAGLVSSFEAMLGLLYFAIATGLLYGRFSKPSAKLLFSKNLLIAPYGDGWSLQFRIANKRSNNLMEMNANLILTFVDRDASRRYESLKLERNSVLFFPLNWTIVHPIDEKSPLWGMSKEEVMNSNMELLILVTGFDDTFSQVVHTRYSYLDSEFVWGARFEPAYQTTESGETVLRLQELSRYTKVSFSGRF